MFSLPGQMACGQHHSFSKGKCGSYPERSACLCACKRNHTPGGMCQGTGSGMAVPFFKCLRCRIEGTGSDTLTITGVEELHGTEFTVPADRIVAGTYVCACAATRGEMVLDGAPVEEMEALMRCMRKWVDNMK